MQTHFFLFGQGKLGGALLRDVESAPFPDSRLNSLREDKNYYILLVVGTAQTPTVKVGYHGPSATTALVCLSTLTTKGPEAALLKWPPD